MHILVIENWPETSLGQIAPALHEAGAVIDRRRMFAGDSLPAGTDGHDGLIVLGGRRTRWTTQAAPGSRSSCR